MRNIFLVAYFILSVDLNFSQAIPAVNRYVVKKRRDTQNVVRRNNSYCESVNDRLNFNGIDEFQTLQNKLKRFRYDSNSIRPTTPVSNLCE